jgi:hypothetical protein
MSVLGETLAVCAVWLVVTPFLPVIEGSGVLIRGVLNFETAAYSSEMSVAKYVHVENSYDVPERPFVRVHMLDVVEGPFARSHPNTLFRSEKANGRARWIYVRPSYASQEKGEINGLCGAVIHCLGHKSPNFIDSAGFGTFNIDKRPLTLSQGVVSFFERPPLEYKDYRSEQARAVSEPIES